MSINSFTYPIPKIVPYVLPHAHYNITQYSAICIHIESRSCSSMPILRHVLCHIPINCTWPYCSVLEFPLHMLSQAWVDPWPFCPKSILPIPTMPFFIFPCPLCFILIKPRAHYPHSQYAHANKLNAHYAPCPICPCQYVQCPLFPMPIMQYAHYVLCFLCPMPHAHYAP